MTKDWPRIFLQAGRSGLFFLLVAPVIAAEPVARWNFDSGAVEGPGAPLYPVFPESNRAHQLEAPQWIVVPDSGPGSRFDFDNGDAITVEAWVNPGSVSGYAYILGKGRTFNPGFPQDNQNWAFRLGNKGGLACVNFLFRSRKTADHPGDWHRWTSNSGFSPGSGWHHVAVTYRFGEPDSVRGYLDGKEVKGSWDMGGATTQPPVVDDDEVWLGSSMKGHRSNSFHGRIDEVALHREILSPEVLKARYRFDPQPFPEPRGVPGRIAVEMFGPIDAINKIPKGGFPKLASWTQDGFGFLRLPHRYDDWGIREDWGSAILVRAHAELDLAPGVHRFLVRSRGMSRLTIDGKVLTTTRSQPNRGGAHHVVDPIPEVPVPGMRPHAMTDDEKLVEFSSPGGIHRILFEIVVGGPRYRLEFGETCVATARPGEMFRILAQEPRYPLTDAGWERFRDEEEASLAALDQENRQSAGRVQEPFWAQRHGQARETLLPLPRESARPGIDATIERRIAAINRSGTATAGAEDEAARFYHRKVEPVLAEHCHRCHGEKEKGGLTLQDRERFLQGGDSGSPAVVPGKPDQSLLVELIQSAAGEDRMPPKGDGLDAHGIAVLTEWIARGAPLPAAREAGVTRPPLVDDATFLRRVYLDTVGVTPPLDVTRAFLASNVPDKRARLIDRLLEDPGWAHNWVGYWQDVLAENPNLLKPNLNNTGPFRWWILEALADNKPMDRFATELILMRGSTWGGGTAGFAVASQNDVPMAAKGHVVASAFLGISMKCARCHDAPYHEWKQEDLFSVAAMLGRKPLTVPSTSSVPAAFFEKQERKSLIEVTLKPGATVAPAWPFADSIPPVDEALLRQPDDTRERLAAQVTASRRFAEVLANRVWARYMGAGIVEPVDDWEGNPPSDPALLAFLADELIDSGYDLKHLARLILGSDTYQRAATDREVNSPAEKRLFAGPYRRRMSAEQIVDSAFHAVGRRMKTEPLTMDMEGTLPPSTFLHFGRPERAWEFTTLANERDRPSLALPRIQAVADTLKAFGWRNARPEPSSHREEEPNLIQPGVLANGVMGTWLTRLTDDSGVTALARRDVPLSRMVEDLFLQILTRYPTPGEATRFTTILEPGYAARLVPEREIQTPPEPVRFRYVTWSNHLNSEANRIKVEMEEAARRGDPPTRYLRPEWRARMEDAVWALLNAPELVMIP